MLRATLFRAADTARRHDPQLARIYYLQMAEGGATHLKACCVVAGHLAGGRAPTRAGAAKPGFPTDRLDTPASKGIKSGRGYERSSRSRA